VRAGGIETPVYAIVASVHAMATKTIQDDLTLTAHLSAEDLSAVWRRSAEPPPEVLLSVRHSAGTEVVVLRRDAPVVVGRHAPADLVVPDRSLSRAHARLTLGGQGQIKVEDLGSTNGTWLQGVRVTSADVSPGAELLFGDTHASIHVLAPVRPGVADSPGPRAEPSGDGAPIAVAPAMKLLLETAARLAESSIPVILHGETGTGKEVIASYLHERGPRRGAPLVSINCAAIPPSLLESVLFGHERGAFTGALQQRKGIFEEADGGTLFLDEIAELPLPAQAALLRVLETKRVARVGGVKESTVDVRIVAATHRDLQERIEAGAFRADLYYRLCTMVLEIPPLRERREEIELLALRFLARSGQDRVRRISAAALEKLCAYSWPGNVRELRNVVERAVVVARGPLIEPEDLPERIHQARLISATPAAPAVEPADGPMTVRRPSTTSLPADPSPPSGQDLRSQLQSIEARRLTEALEATGWNQAEAARRLGLPARTLSNKIRALGLKRPNQ
jgi:two-component system, NtrC family, response regulator AtoC